MIRKILIITVLALLPFFFTTCGGSGTAGGDATVKITFDGVSKLKSIEGIPVTQKAPISRALSTSIDTIRIKVYVGTEAEGTIFDETIDVTDNITIEVPSGLSRIFKVYALANDGSLFQKAVSTPIDLVGGEETNVSLTLGPNTPEADFSVKLLAEDGKSDFADPLYLSSGIKFIADVYRPTIDNQGTETTVDDKVELNSVISSASSSSFTTSLSISDVYATTPQIVIVRAFTLNNTIAAIGIAAFADLSDGLNSTPIPVVMNRPGKLIITNDSPINTLEVTISSYGVVATNGISNGPNSVIVSVPNNTTNIGSGFDSGTSDFQIKVNGTTYTKTGILVRWKAWDVLLPVNTWIQK